MNLSRPAETRVSELVIIILARNYQEEVSTEVERKGKRWL